jgi:hypothetical protein
LEGLLSFILVAVLQTGFLALHVQGKHSFQAVSQTAFQAEFCVLVLVCVFCDLEKKKLVGEIVFRQVF